jgi:predicted amidohydrolase
VIEGAGRGTLYNTCAHLRADWRVVESHRKLVPTFNERLIWGPGDGNNLQVVETAAGRVGSLDLLGALDAAGAPDHARGR